MTGCKIMELFDTHFHFSGEESFEEFITRCQADLRTAGAGFAPCPDRLLMLCAGADHQESLRAQEFAARYPDVYFACGIHPHAAAEYLECPQDFSGFKNDRKLLALGEIGLDYFYDFSDPASQKKVLEEFLELALQWQKPAMLHLRDKDDTFQAYQDALEMLTGFAGAGGRFVIHCYAGNRDYAEKFLALGGYFGVTGMYTFKAASNIREVISQIPDDRLLIETDAPYLTPVPYRGKSNTPGMVALVARALGCDRQMTPETAAELFTGNGKRFYQIGE